MNYTIHAGGDKGFYVRGNSSEFGDDARILIAGTLDECLQFVQAKFIGDVDEYGTPKFIDEPELDMSRREQTIVLAAAILLADPEDLPNEINIPNALIIALDMVNEVMEEAPTQIMEYDRR